MGDKIVQIQAHRVYPHGFAPRTRIIALTESGRLFTTIIREDARQEDLAKQKWETILSPEA